MRKRIDDVTQELVRLQALDMETLGDASRAYKDFVDSSAKLLRELTNLADSVSDD